MNIAGISRCCCRIDHRTHTIPTDKGFFNAFKQIQCSAMAAEARPPLYPPTSHTQGISVQERQVNELRPGRHEDQTTAPPCTICLQGYAV
ncbi:hypothetical protein TNCV_1377321 [Trichonephila clavipes]|nr:hypothetical protein TNCV_1377321 [Trichonephila clavipes]